MLRKQCQPVQRHAVQAKYHREDIITLPSLPADNSLYA